jgi:predicted membrane protein
METNNEYRDENKLPRREFHNHLTNNRVIIGVILVLAGLFLVIRNTGFFPDFIDNVIFSWPMLLVTIGIIMTIGATEKTAGIIIMAVGGFFMIPLIFRETFHMYNMFWPSIFIIIGVIFIATKQRVSGGSRSKGMTGDDVIDYINIFSGGERQIVSQNFKGGKITAVFGGIELDLTKAKMAPVLGGFSDSRKLTPGRTVDSTSQLVLRGAVIFGGGEIKSY